MSLRFCGCGAVVDGKCSRCKPMGQEQRASSTERGYGSDWQAIRERKVSLNPLCERCEQEGIIKAAEEVHHVAPIRIAPERRLDISNLMSVCRACHKELERDV